MTEEKESIEFLGEGTFGTVYRHGCFAVKQIPKRPTDTIDEHHLREIVFSSLLQLGFASLVQVHDIKTHKETDSVFSTIHMECYSGTLADVIQNYRFSLRTVRVWFRSLLKALFILHILGIHHGDLKPHNILYCKDTGQVALCDMSSAIYVPLRREFISVTPCEHGTLGWRAPETIVGGRYSDKCDIWALGCIMLDLTTKQLPSYFSKKNEGEIQYFERVLKTLGAESLVEWMKEEEEQLFQTGKEIDTFVQTRLTSFGKDRQLQFVETDDPNIVLLEDAIQKMLSTSPKKRMSVFEALAHPFSSKPIKIDDEYIWESIQSIAEEYEPIDTTSSSLFGIEEWSTIRKQLWKWCSSKNCAKEIAEWAYTICKRVHYLAQSQKQLSTIAFASLSIVSKLCHWESERTFQWQQYAFRKDTSALSNLECTIIQALEGKLYVVTSHLFLRWCDNNKDSKLFELLEHDCITLFLESTTCSLPPWQRAAVVLHHHNLLSEKLCTKFLPENNSWKEILTKEKNFVES